MNYLKNSHNRSILLAFDWHDERVYRGILKFAAEEGWHVSPYMLSESFVPRGWRGDGAITCCGKALRDFLNTLELPVVDISVTDLTKPVPRVIVDNEAVGQMAAQHFIDRGFRHFAYYSWPTVKVNRLRGHAYVNALRAAGMPDECLHTIDQSPSRLLSKWDQHQKHMLDQLNELPRPMAVFAGQDNLGANLIDICIRNGISVPEEIAILGVDNMELMCGCLSVPLSSIDTQLEKVGYEAAQQLALLMRNEISRKAPPRLIPPREVVVRQSTDILAVPHPAVHKAVRLIQEEFSSPLTLGGISAHAGMSKRGLEKAFLAHLGRSPSSELRRVRLENAKRMLTETDEKIEYIARTCGYSNSSNLSVAFNKETDMSPRAYRQTYQKHQPIIPQHLAPATIDSNGNTLPSQSSYTRFNHSNIGFES